MRYQIWCHYATEFDEETRSKDFLGVSVWSISYIVGKEKRTFMHFGLLNFLVRVSLTITVCIVSEDRIIYYRLFASQHFMFRSAYVGFNGSTFVELRATLAIVTVSENGSVFVVLILVILDSEGGAKWCSNVL